MPTPARLAIVFLLLAPAWLSAQRGPTKAEVAPLVETETVTPGSDVRVALQVELPDGYHMNSNKPRDSSLIPVVVSVPSPDQAMPDGVSLAEIVFPSPTDLKQRG